jgi:hypothetical protein
MTMEGGQRMKDTPIIFSSPMVKALLDGRKTMTRRIAWYPPTPNAIGTNRPAKRKVRLDTLWQRVQPGDRLWVRETWAIGASTGNSWHSENGPVGDMRLYQRRYAADNDKGFYGRWRSPIHMPRWASRLTLIVTATKIERLQDIPLLDVWAEGCEVRQYWLFGADAKERQRIGANVFHNLWSDLHGRESWDANPEVVALTFKVVKQNIDGLSKQKAA